MKTSGIFFTLSMIFILIFTLCIILMIGTSGISSEQRVVKCYDRYGSEIIDQKCIKEIINIKPTSENVKFYDIIGAFSLVAFILCLVGAVALSTLEQEK